MVKTMPDKLVIATHNRGKVEEFRSLLSGFWRNFAAAADLGLAEPEETGLTFVDNALLKARAAAGRDHWALADDSGLCVNALGGDPGIYSARWAGPDKNFKTAMLRVHEALGAAVDRSAYFICVLVLIAPDGQTHIVEGRCAGKIVWPPRGLDGFGYDPCFVPDGESRTFAEMPEAEKNAISHRAKAVRQMIDFLEHPSEIL